VPSPPILLLDVQASYSCDCFCSLLFLNNHSCRVDESSLANVNVDLPVPSKVQVWIIGAVSQWLPGSPGSLGYSICLESKFMQTTVQ
jgi:hypothetical protein